MRATVYIAGPFAGETASDIDRNVERATWLAKVAHLFGRAPVLMHRDIRDGVYGDDNDPDGRAAGLESAIAIACACNTAWFILRDDGSLSAGCRAAHAARYDLAMSNTVRSWSSWVSWATLALGDRFPPLPRMESSNAYGAF